MKNVGLLILGAVVGLVVGLWLSSPQQMQQQEPARLSPVEHVVDLSVEDKKIQGHAAIYVSEERGDTVIWSSETLEDFTVDLKCVNPTGHTVPCPSGQPRNPFQRTDPLPWRAENGIVRSNRAKPSVGVQGFKYKFTVTAGDLESLDPHIVFSR
jgi:hypothetical protein